MASTFECEFLRMAMLWMSCRYQLMQGRRYVGSCYKPDVEFDLRGMLDAEGEMRLICKGYRCR